MTDTTSPKPSRLLRELVRWAVALAILWFLGSRVARDWPAVRVAVQSMRIEWLLIGLIPGLLYIPLRVAAWRATLKELDVHVPFGLAATVWANGEIIRYIPGNVWSVVGRIAQAGKLNTTRTKVFASMLLETFVLVFAATAVSAVGLLPYTRYDFPFRMVGLLAVAGLAVVMVSPRPLNWLVRIVERLFRKQDLGRVQRGFPAFTYMVLAWLAYGFLQLCITSSLGAFTNGVAAIAMMGIFTVSWLIGYLSFITPSGLGVREAVLVFLLEPYVGVATAVAIAVVSRVLMILVEVTTVLIVNSMARRKYETAS